MERARTTLAVEQTLRRMRTEAPGGAARQRLRQHAIMLSLPIAHRLVRRYRRCGEPLDDLHQVAAIGLINAIDRYDPTHGDSFVAFAVPTILGEVKRHFRDRTWSVHVPRRLQEMRWQIAAATEVLSHRLSRSPTPAELAEHVGVDEDTVIDGLQADRCYAVLSLEGPGIRREVLGDEIGHEDDSFQRSEARAVVEPALRRLPRRERQILYLRFFENLSQTEIAARVGVSQMHVSRLIRKSLERLRGHLSGNRASRGLETT